METVRYSLISKSDIKLEPRNATFEVTLPDNSVAVLSALDVAYLLADAYNAADVPSNLITGQLYRLKDSLRGLWAINQSGFAFALNGEMANLMEFGAKGDGLTDDTTAFNSAVAALVAAGGGTLIVPPGTYRFLSAPDAITAGVLIQGVGGIGTTQNNGTCTLLADYLEGTAANGFLNWTGASGAGLGGGIVGVSVWKGSGKQGGSAIKFTGTSDSLRSGLNFVARVDISGGGTWDHGLLVDGTSLNTSGNQGIRGTFVKDVRIDGCNVAQKSVWLKNATEFMASNLRVAQGLGANTCGVTVTGASGSNASSTNIAFASLLDDGDFVCDYATKVSVDGVVLGTISISANTSYFSHGGPITTLENISNASTTTTFETPLGDYVSGPYMRTLTNQTGVALVAGDVVALDASNDSAVTLQDSSGALFTYVVANQAIANGSKGPFTTAGIVAVNVTGTVTRGHYIRKSATTKTAEDTGTAQGGSQAPPTGTIGVAMTADSGGVATIDLYGGFPASQSSGSAGLTITSSTQDVTTSETTTSTSYTNLATTGPAVTLSPGGSTTQIIGYSSAMKYNGGGDLAMISPSIAGAAASDVDAQAISSEPTAGTSERGGNSLLASGVGNGSTHTLKYKSKGGNTATFSNRRIYAFTIS